MNGGQCSGIYSLLGTNCKSPGSRLTVRCVNRVTSVPYILFVMFISI